MLRSSRSASNMGLLEGLQTLQGAPPPRGDPLAPFGNGAKSVFGELSNSLSDGVGSLGQGMKGGVTSIRRMMGDESIDDLEAPQQQTAAEEMGQLLNLTMFQRIVLFTMTFAAGVVLVFISFSFLPLIVVVPHKFAASFSMGNVLCICSTWILVGPRAQLQTMFHPVRAVAAGIYIASLLFALLAAFFGGKLRYLLVLIALVAEVGSRKYFWYPVESFLLGRRHEARV
jgi:uncharacterized membrane protein